MKWLKKFFGFCGLMVLIQQIGKLSVKLIEKFKEVFGRKKEKQEVDPAQGLFFFAKNTTVIMKTI